MSRRGATWAGPCHFAVHFKTCQNCAAQGSLCTSQFCQFYPSAHFCSWTYIPPVALTVSFLIASVSQFFFAVSVTCHIPPEPRSPAPSYVPAPLSVPLMTVFISGMFIDGMAAMRKVVVTSAPEIGLPSESVNLTFTVLL